jgi:hypothetical protein
MAYRHDDDAKAPTGAALPGALSRRQALTAASALAAAAGAASADNARPGSESTGRPVGLAEPQANAAEFRARFMQTGTAGQDFVAFGYLTRLVGTTDADLFVGTSQNEGAALFTAYASGKLVRRTLDRSVRSLDIEGTLTVYQRAAMGASFDAPASFQVGQAVARFDLELQNILTVFVPGRGLPTLTGAMHQTLADKLAGTPGGRRFGHVGSRARFFATGVGDLIDPSALTATLEMAGNWSIE